MSQEGLSGVRGLLLTHQMKGGHKQGFRGRARREEVPS